MSIKMRIPPKDEVWVYIDNISKRKRWEVSFWHANKHEFFNCYKIRIFGASQTLDFNGKLQPRSVISIPNAVVIKEKYSCNIYNVKLH